MTGTRTIRKVLIANRGEIALRVIRTCRELGIRTVAVYSDADRTMPFVLHADEAYRIGPPPSRESYLMMDTIIHLARAAGADAIHPGYGFLSENAEFARRVGEAGIIFIGPPHEAIRSMGDKTEARKLVRQAGVPTVPGTEGPVQSEEEVKDFCSRHGYPILIKAAAGGGGKGMRVVRDPEDLSQSLRSAQSEARSAFGDDRVYVEKYIENPRHIEFQVLADRFGNTIHLGERECSIQRRHQKVVEETPSVIVDDRLRSEMGKTAVDAAKACGYINAGTIEFLVDGSRNFYFLEMNTRLQVEHPVTELRTGLDLVAEQIRIAEGHPIRLGQEEVRFSGHAIECRICAEDVENDFLPSTGSILHLRPPQGPGLREDRGVEEGGEIPVYYDSMISKLVAWAPTREEALRKMERGLTEYEILGVKTNISLCLFVIRHPEFRAGNFDTHFLPRYFSGTRRRETTEEERRAIALVCAILESQDHLGSQTGPEIEVSGSTGKGWLSKRSDGLR